MLIKNLNTNIKNSITKSFLFLILLTTNACAMKIPESIYDAQTQTTKYTKTLTSPIAVPFDITKKGNKIEMIVKIKEDNSYSFELEFRYDDPSVSKYWIVEFFRVLFLDWRKPYTQDELEVILKDEHRVGKLVGGKFPKRPGHPDDEWENYPGIPTPIHLTITKIEDGGREVVVFDEIRDKWDGQNFVGCSGASCNKELQRMLLKKGNYKIFAQVIKDSPELVGTKIYFTIGIGRTKY